jgi:hypothetical protein
MLAVLFGLLMMVASVDGPRRIQRNRNEQVPSVPMSALGHKQTCALQKTMSALPLIATTKADIRKPPCLVYPQKRTCAVQREMSAKGQKRTWVAIQSLHRRA